MTIAFYANPCYNLCNLLTGKVYSSFWISVGANVPQTSNPSVAMNHFREEVCVANKQKSAVDQEKERLLAERATVEEELLHLREQMQSEVDVEPDEGDAEINEREKNAALILVLERRIANIDTALEAVESGSYGICTRCGKPIEPGRLEIKPDATLCVTCQGEVEKANRRGRPTRQVEW